MVIIMINSDIMMIYGNIPSGKRVHSYWKWQENGPVEIVDDYPAI